MPLLMHQPYQMGLTASSTLGSTPFNKWDFTSYNSPKATQPYEKASDFNGTNMQQKQMAGLGRGWDAATHVPQDLFLKPYLLRSQKRGFLAPPRSTTLRHASRSFSCCSRVGITGADTPLPHGRWHTCHGKSHRCTHRRLSQASVGMAHLS